MKEKSLLVKFFNWRVKHITDRQFMLILSAVIGLLSGIAAVTIKNMVHFTQHFLTGWFTEDNQNYLYIVLPIIGILIVVIFIKFILRNSIGDGVPNVLYAISKSNGMMKLHNVYSSVIASTLTVGFGGSVGLEGPTVATGAAIGSNLGRILHLNYKQIVSLLGFASAGAMAAIFKAPIAAIVFALEVIMLDLTITSIIPLLIASTVAALTSYFFLGQNVLYPFEVPEVFQLNDILFYLVLGVLSGLFSVYFIRTIDFSGKLFKKIKSWVIRLIIGGAALGILVFLFPALYGEGYTSINASLQGDYSNIFDHSIFFGLKDNIIFTFILLFAIAAFKVIATSATFGSGGIGGIFAPTLFTGANLGLVFALMVNYFNIGDIPPSNFALVGMAGLISGVIRGPLTAIFLIAEITGGYELIMPLMIVATVSFATSKLFEPDSVYTIQLSKRIDLITHNKDKAAFSLMKIDSLIEKNFTPVDADATLGDLVKVIANSSRNIYPVVDKENSFIGLVFLDRVRHIMFNPEKYDTVKVRNLMFMPTTVVHLEDHMEDVAQKFQHSGKYNLVVIDNGKYVGFVSRATVFSKYRELLKSFSEH
ncbi:MAG: chloride channel protein [Bacteroidetes bacterium 4484_249]|nr:MAG: chloride channel protein [Bacteroidetes bacterium 4484_249]